MVTRTQDLLWRATLDEIRGLRRDVQEFATILRGDNSSTQRAAAERSVSLPGQPLLTPDEVATVLRTSRKSVYSMIERGQLPGIVRLGRKILVRRDRLLRWLSKEERSR
jgi:excisionase family DNA binding protein